LNDLNRIFGYVEENQPRIHEIIRRIVEKPSANPPGDTTEAAEAIASLMSSIGLEVELVKSAEHKINVVGEWDLGRQQSVLFNGHLDTVPVGDESLWSFDPYRAEISDGWMYGRGVADDKGAVGCVIAALEGLKKLGLEPAENIIVHAVCDEEVGGELGTHYMVKQGYASKASYGFVLEASTSRNRIFVRNSMKGSASLTVTVQGKTAHAANPTAGINANLEMSKLLLALDRTRFTFKRSKYLTPPTIAAGTIVQGGEKSNVIPGKCTSTSDIRYLPGMTEESIRRDIERVISRLKRTNKKLNVSYELKLGKHKAVELDERQPVVSKARDMIRKVVGYTPRVMGGYGATDASFLILDGKVPTLVGLGPADIEYGNVHGINERVSVSKLLEFTKIYAGLAIS
jgi:succinyl-diaminopimelate desuccinylase